MSDSQILDGNIVTHQRFKGRGGDLNNGGGGGTFDPMEQRVRQLETDIAYIKGKLDDMPTKDWMNNRLLAYFGAAVAAVTLITKFL